MQPDKKTYTKILKSSSIIGGSEVVRILIGMVQVKFTAIFLGPLGVGLIGTYNSLILFIQHLAGLGISESGVREVAKSIGKYDQEHIGRTVLILRRMCWVTGLTGSLIVLFFAQSLSRITFGTTEHSWALALLAWIILINNVQQAQKAYLQGLRRIGDLARLKIIGAVGGATIGVGFYAWLGLDGIVPALLSVASLNLAASWWFARKIPPPRVATTWKESFRSSGGLLRLGFAFMWNGLLLAAVEYLTRLMIAQKLGLNAVGIFQSSFAMSGLFVGFVLQAMAADYYPRLAAVSSDNEKMNKMVNEQIEIGLLLTVPGMLATLSFAPWVIRIFYTAEFFQAAELLKWFILGCLGRVISWPIGFIMLAKGKSMWFSGTQTFFNLLHFLLIWLGIVNFGIIGVSIAFCLLYLISTTTVNMVARHLTGFTWNSKSWELLLITLSIVCGVFLVSQFVQGIYLTFIGTIVTFATSIYCLRELTSRLGPEHKICRTIQNIPLFKYLVPNKYFG